MTWRHRDETGGVTLFALSCLALLLFLGAALGVVAAMVRVHRSAQAAADLAALAGASSLASGRDPCAAAAEIARANGALTTSCVVSGRDVVVVVEAPGPRWLGQSADLIAQARAGP